MSRREAPGHAEQDDAVEPAGTGTRFRVPRLVQRLVLPALSLVLFIIAVWAIHRELADISYPQLRAQLAATPLSHLALAALASALSYLSMSGYDRSALHHTGIRLPFPTVMLASFCSYAVSNTVGFGALSGGSVRYRIYRAAGVPPMDIARITIYCLLSFTGGIVTFGAIGLIIYPGAVNHLLHLPPALVRGAGFVLVALVGAFILFTFIRKGGARFGRWNIVLPSGGMALVQIAIALAELTFAALTLYVLLPADSGVPFGGFLVVFVLGIVSGIVSHVPGGLGVFEGIMLVGLPDTISNEQLTAALILYRLLYYLLPLVVAAVALGGVEFAEQRANAHNRQHAVQARMANVTSSLVPSTSAAIAFMGGVILLLSTVMPGLAPRLEALRAVVPFAAMEGAQLLAALTGVALLVVAHGLWQRLRTAYRLALILYAVGIATCLLKAFDYEEAACLALMALLLAPTGREFHTRTPLGTLQLPTVWIVAMFATLIGLVAITVFTYRDMPSDSGLLWQLTYVTEASRAMRAILLAGCAVAVVALWQLFRLMRYHALRRRGPQ